MFEDIILKHKKKKLRATWDEEAKFDTSVFAGIDGICNNISKMSSCPNYVEQDINKIVASRRALRPITCKYFFIKGGRCIYHNP